MTCTAPDEVPFFFCLFGRWPVGSPIRHGKCGNHSMHHGSFYKTAPRRTFIKCTGLFTMQCTGLFTVVSTVSMHDVVYRPMHAVVYAIRSKIHCTWSFTPICKNQCTWSFTTFFGILRPSAIGRKEGKRAFCMAEKAPGPAFYPVKSWPVAACIASACLSWVILYPLRKDA